MGNRQLQSQCRLWFGLQGHCAQQVVAFAVAAVVGARLRASVEDMQYILRVAFVDAELDSAIKADTKTDVRLLHAKSVVALAAQQIAVTVCALMANGGFAATAIEVV